MAIFDKDLSQQPCYTASGRPPLTFLCLAISGWLTSLPGLAQDEPATLEEVVVLGSLIPRADYTSVSPVYTINREALEIDGRNTMADLLNRYPQFQPRTNSATVNLTNPRGRRSSIDLRSLGPQRTLPLLNGRRLGPSGTDGQIDINTLPVGLIEQVEVLTGGASSSYGSDAIAGVVNFSLRDRVDGVEIDTRFSRTDRGDGDTGNLSILGGLPFANGNGQITGFFGYLDQDAIPSTAREISSVPIYLDQATGLPFEGGTTAVPGGWSWLGGVVDGQYSPDGFTFNRAGNPVAASFPEDVYNTAAYENLRGSLERKSAGAFVHYTLSDSTELDLGLLLTQKDSEDTFAPSPQYLGGLVINLDNPLLTPKAREAFATSYDPAGFGVIAIPYDYRPLDMGPRKRNYEQDNSWFNIELKGQWGTHWRWNMAYTYSDASMTLAETGGVSSSRLRQGVLVNPETGDCYDTSNGCVPVDIFGVGRLSDDAVDFLYEGEFVTREDTEQQVISLRANRSWQLARELDLAAAFGLEWRQDKGDFNPDSALREASSYLGFFEHIPSAGKDDVTEVYGEVLLPLVQSSAWAELLEAELGARYSDYSKIDGEWTYKAGLNWHLNGGIRFRAAYARAARAPNISESYLAFNEFERQVFGATVYDPCAASNRPQDFDGREQLCIEQGIAAENLASYEPAQTSIRVIEESGNLELDSETADTYTIGGLWQPESIPGFYLSLDYFDIEVEGFIFKLPSNDSFNLCFLTGKAGGYCGGIERTAVGDVSRLRSTFNNLGGRSIKGYDLNLDYTLPHAVPWGWPSDLSISLLATKNHSNEVDLGQGVTVECNGRFGDLCRGVIPDYRSYTTVGYRTGPLFASLNWRWLSSVKNDNGLRIPEEQSPQLVDKIDSQDYLDLYLGWNWNDTLTLSFNVTNLTDNDPPLMPWNSGGSNMNTDPAVYDVYGRRYSAGLNFRF
jgi:iron complex outermembrane recepter protein